MAVSIQRGGLNRGDLATERVKLKFPNPGDIFIMVAFAWATVCFLLVVGGDQITRRLSLLTGSRAVRDLLLTEQTAIGGLMVVGIVGLAVAFSLISRFRQATIAALFFAMTFANASWVPLYGVSFSLKYLILVYLGAFTLLFFIKNGWRLVETEGYRLVVAYVGWIAFVVVIQGISFQNVWYLATEFTLMIGLGIAWLYHIDSSEKLAKFNRMLAWVGVAALAFHLLSIAVAPVYSVMGRFVGMSGRATGFATIFAIYVIAMFWMSMVEKNAIRQRFFTVAAFAGYGLILWSGTRNATVAALIGIVALWWVTRTKLLVYIVAAGMIGLIVQIILGDNQDVTALSSRLASTENTRLGAWELYTGLILKSPIYGYGYDGLISAVYGEALIGVIGSYVRIGVPGVHNQYIGFGVRWGLVGLVLQLALFYYPAVVAWKVIFSRRVAMQDKRIYILPVSILLVVLLEGLFEDTMGSTGRGTIHGMVFAIGIPIVYLHGKRLLAAAETSKEGLASKSKELIRRRRSSSAESASY